MMNRGFFSTMVLAGLIVALVAASRIEIKQEAGISAREAEMAGMEDASLGRAEAEAYLDRAIENAVDDSLVPPIEAGKTKSMADNAIVSAFESLGLNGWICENAPNGTRKTEALTRENIGRATKAIAVKASGTTTVMYIVTGGESGKLVPCSEIVRGNYSLIVEAPAGYRAMRVVPWQ